ncbi:MAG: glycosyl hydrolase family 28-related protein, partial [Kiritimatiellota bacterium]|nr:glycosyl hydrolase family 28-related protein [Kiritimatiellota bacterium]
MNRYGFSKKFVAGLGMAIGLELALSVGMAAEGVPEICAASIVAENQTLVYGANFDDEALAVHVQHRPQPVKDEQPPGTEELAASFERFRSGKAELPAVPDGKDRGWRKVEHKEASILLCDTLNPWWYPGVKILRVRNTHGVSKPYRAGVPEIWGASPREVFPGESLTVWGVNIGEQFALRSDKSGKVEIRKGHRPYNTHSHRPELQFIRRLIVPENMGAGEYSLYNWRDFGDAGWSEPISIRVASRPEQPKAIVNVKDNGAAGDGVKDDTEAVLKAIARAKELDGWVLLPAGRYVVSQSLELPEGVRLIGHGAESTVIESSAWKTFAEGAQFPERVLSRPPDYDPKTYQRTGWGIDWRMAGAFQTQTYMVWLKSYSGLENITLDARNSLRINPVVLVADDHGAVCRNPVIRNCRILGRPEGHFADGPDRYAATYAAQGILSAGSTEDMVIEHTVI